MKSVRLLNAEICKSTIILQHFAGKDEALFMHWNSFRILDFLLDALDSVESLHVQSNDFARDRLHEDVNVNAHFFCIYFS